MSGDHRLRTLLVAVALTFLIGGCNSDDPPLVNILPTLLVSAPAQDTDMQIGDPIQIRYTDNDPDDTATTNLFADADGNIATQGDQFLIASRTENDGAQHVVNWDTTGVPEGSYFIVGVVSDGTNGPVSVVCPGKVNVWNLWPRDHSRVAMKDRFGNAIPVGSTTPYSPRQTCGTCHDVDEIANGYHFQQGRTDGTGAVHAKNDFFGDGRKWLLSDGMYGKW